MDWMRITGAGDMSDFTHMSAKESTLFMRAARGEPTPGAPIWLMRQAGRCDPAYRALREETPLALEALFSHPELAARISLLPGRWGVDAIILFQDILSPLAGMGAPFVFRPGPVPKTPLADADAFKALHACELAETMPFIREAMGLIRAAIGDAMPLLGFAGAPLTLLAFLAEGGSPPPELPRTRALIAEDPDTAAHVLDLLTTMTIAYLRYQRDCGADAVQLFESAAQYFSADEYQRLALPFQQRIFNALRGEMPTIFFARLTDAHLPVELLADAGADILSLPATLSIAEARARLGDALRVQGNLDNRLLAQGDHKAIAHAAKACLDQGECRGHIFNLSHGLLADTPFENVRFLVDYVKAWPGN